MGGSRLTAGRAVPVYAATILTPGGHVSRLGRLTSFAATFRSVSTLPPPLRPTKKRFIVEFRETLPES
jgi:hypothetical protein